MRGTEWFLLCFFLWWIPVILFAPIAHAYNISDYGLLELIAIIWGIGVLEFHKVPVLSPPGLGLYTLILVIAKSIIAFFAQIALMYIYWVDIHIGAQNVHTTAYWYLSTQ